MKGDVSLDFYQVKDVIFGHLAQEAFNVLKQMGEVETAQAIVDSFRERY